jgi:hypothetical protein
MALIRKVTCSGYHWTRDWTLSVLAECAWAITQLDLSRCAYLTGALPLPPSSPCVHMPAICLTALVCV